MTELTELGGVEAARMIAAGELTSVELTRACLDRIAERDGTIHAWAFVDPELALAQAHAADVRQAAGEPLAPLHGVPVGIKDIIDTEDMPTERGTPIHAGRRPDADAQVVALLRDAGTVILGKTVTTEFAVFSPADTVNPLDPRRTPGGSSSGSAASVADRMVPLAIGTQTKGSVLRPSSFCGLVGYKPSFGLVPRAGVLKQSPTLDHIGPLVRSVPDAALVAEQIVDHDPSEPLSRAYGGAPLFATAMEDPEAAPRFGFTRDPYWDRVDEDAKRAFAALLEGLGGSVESFELPADFDDPEPVYGAILEYDLAHNFADDYANAGDRFSPHLAAMMERGAKVPEDLHRAAVARQPELRNQLSELFEWYDAILTPTTTGEAPIGLNTTGDPSLCTIATLTGLPAVTIPILRGANGLPIGVQMIGRFDGDGELLRTARVLMEAVKGVASPYIAGD